MKSSLHFLVAARQHEMAALEQLGKACSLVVAMSSLVHALQKERGLSNMVLASGGAQGAELLAPQRLLADAQIANVRDELDRLGPHPSGGSGARLCNAIAYTLQGVAALPALRAQVQAGGLTPVACTDAFARLIAGCLAVVFEAADSANEPEISRMLVALFHLMQGKELAGQERACGTSAFASGQLQPPARAQWLHLIESQERCFEVFASLASARVLLLWQAHVAGDTDMAAVERMRRVAHTAAGCRLSRSGSADWFAACSHRLDALHGVETLVAQELQVLCLHKLQAQEQALAALQVLPPGAEGVAGAAEGGMAFFEASAPPDAWSLDAVGAPALGRDILSLVQQQSQRLQTMQSQIHEAKTALHERKTLERAKGLLMAQHQLSESDAYQLLRQTAMNQNKRMLEVAEAVLAMAAMVPTVPSGAAGPAAAERR
ncbi:nitrate- and nitrite sensing domain-containing protein [Comamonas piscis]|uniref:Nitrate-and nitrite sensing domain-containing protein n=1 Tax=Comamonas piscis TaxID=1562974 RepID=A0A7G5EEN6_9BURK|nr:nitrate regulatory protein [Comamonas piscis]QMV72461.1 nitrate- and nitrite sensing domain-containing protein [Comamonas piscis]WSO35231.1 nitrate- and nitrite sensing domain-containing protein [Comamonas piscis]